ncbi:MAG: efflux RND transporter periplasmic adaptor subunit [Xanthobacteraceae bacterium]|nr:efflux RND transporter periplasmic adaptor subunit [Xanthobacteraceae bacterium]QYK45568.1 MAG: efflux RND transporter periplasmic adaptor subunit [Xanthobacteraceae bacterium]
MLQKPDNLSKLESLRGRFRDRRFLLGSLIAATLLLAGGYYFFSGSGQDAASFRTEPVTKGDLEKTVTALAQVRPKNWVDIGTQVSGQLRKVHVEIGDNVPQGKLLAEIDPTVYQTRVLAGRAKIDNLRAQLEQARAQLMLDRTREERSRQLLATNSTSRDAYDAALATLKIDEAKISSFEAQIKEMEATLEGDVANLNYTKIFAPLPGTIVNQIAFEGQTLNANQTAPIIVRIADLDVMTVWAQVAEADIPRITVGMPVYFTTLGMPDRRFNATVRQIYPTPEIVNDVILYNVLIDVPNKERELMTNMTAQVFFVLGAVKDAVLVPVQALRPSQRDKDTYFVRVIENGEVKNRRVKVGLQDRNVAEVLSGLKEGESVVIGQVQRSGSDKQRTGIGVPKFK